MTMPQLMQLQESYSSPQLQNFLVLGKLITADIMIIFGSILHKLIAVKRNMYDMVSHFFTSEFSYSVAGIFCPFAVRGDITERFSWTMSGIIMSDYRGCHITRTTPKQRFRNRASTTLETNDTEALKSRRGKPHQPSFVLG